MNSLEDAFINIGMDEHNFIESNDHTIDKIKQEYNNFSDIKIPDCLKNPPTYRF